MTTAIHLRASATGLGRALDDGACERGELALAGTELAGRWVLTGRGIVLR
jgi:hypothetical protein